MGKAANGVEIKEDIPKGQLYFDQSIVSTLEPMGQYQASKLAAHTATLDFIETEKPRFYVVTIHPVFVFGPNILQASPDELSGTNAMLFKSLCSEESMMAPYRGVQVEDVAEAHIRALGVADAPISSYLLSAEYRQWEEMVNFAKKKYPHAGFKSKPKSGDWWNVHTARAERELGFSS